MNRSLKLSMLVALALGSAQAVAVDLGQIQVKSALGQPLLAEIPVRPGSPAELQGLTVKLASSEEFARAGIVGGRTAIPLNFSVANGSGGKVIRITSSQVVDDPYLDLLLEVSSSAGKSVREFPILLDPPGFHAAAPAPAAAPATPVAAAPASPRNVQPVAQPRPAAPAARAPTASGGEYGPVERGQNLSSIARSTAPAGVDVQQMMLALKQANPDAFFRDNINALKSGAVLRVPTAAEAQAMTMAAAIAEVRRQNSDWRAGTPARPAVVADAATRSTNQAAAGEATDTGDRLALVPAKEGSGTQSQGGGKNSDGQSAAKLRQELLRNQESLASLQQQSTELKSRLSDLTEINSKNERLLSLKDNEIAELQAKLAAARKSAGMPAAAMPAAATSAAAATTAASSEHLETVTANASAASAPSPAGTVAANGEPSPAASVSMAAPVPAASSTNVAAAPPVAEPDVKPVEEPAATVPASATVEEPWYMQPWAWGAGGAGVVLLILLGMLGRRRKPAAAAATGKSSTSLADRFGAVPATGTAGTDDIDQNELLDQLAGHPDDIGLHLELVTLYYSRRDVEHFEAAAEAMYAHVTDPQQDEWQDVLHMGEDLTPGHPLFDHHAELPPHEETEARREFDIDDYAHHDDAPTVVSQAPPPLPNEPKKVSEYNFNFDLTRPVVAESAAEHSLSSEDATVVAPLAPPAPAPEPAPTAVADAGSEWHFDDLDSSSQPAEQGLDGFSDDPVDTKLDLARAYMDMGDADGARAMLGEVMKEGSQMQQDVAKRLLETLR